MEHPGLRTCSPQPPPPQGMHNPDAEKSALGEGCSSILVRVSLGFTADDALQTAQAPLSYQGIFEIHQPSVIHGEPPLLESFCLLESQEVPDYTPKQAAPFSLGTTQGFGVVLGSLEDPGRLEQFGKGSFWDRLHPVGLQKWPAIREMGWAGL